MKKIFYLATALVFLLLSFYFFFNDANIVGQIRLNERMVQSCTVKIVINNTIVFNDKLNLRVPFHFLELGEARKGNSEIEIFLNDIKVYSESHFLFFNDQYFKLELFECDAGIYVSQKRSPFIFQ